MVGQSQDFYQLHRNRITASLLSLEAATRLKMRNDICSWNRESDIRGSKAVAYDLAEYSVKNIARPFLPSVWQSTKQPTSVVDTG